MRDESLINPLIRAKYISSVVAARLDVISPKGVQQFPSAAADAAISVWARGDMRRSLICIYMRRIYSIPTTNRENQFFNYTHTRAARRICALDARGGGGCASSSSSIRSFLSLSLFKKKSDGTPSCNAHTCSNAKKKMQKNEGVKYISIIAPPVIRASPSGGGK